MGKERHWRKSQTNEGAETISCDEKGKKGLTRDGKGRKGPEEGWLRKEKQSETVREEEEGMKSN